MKSAVLLARQEIELESLRRREGADQLYILYQYVHKGADEFDLVSRSKNEYEFELPVTHGLLQTHPPQLDPQYTEPSRVTTVGV